jgi:hypothetical protein
MTELVRVRQNSYINASEDQAREARGNRRGELVVSDFWLQMALDGRMFGVTIGAEDDAINSTGSIDDEAVFALSDAPLGTTIIPATAQAQVATWTTSALLNMMLEADMGKVRFSAVGGGGAFVPINLRADTPRVSTAPSYVNLTTGAGVTAAAKSATAGGVGSLEFYRVSLEVNLGDAADPFVEFRWAGRTPPILVGPASFLFHFGCGTADVTAYGYYDFAELPTDSVV